MEPGDHRGIAPAPRRSRHAAGIRQQEQTLGRKGGEVTVDSRGWADSKDRFAIDIVGGSKAIEVVERQA